MLPYLWDEETSAQPANIWCAQPPGMFTLPNVDWRKPRPWIVSFLWCFQFVTISSRLSLYQALDSTAPPLLQVIHIHLGTLALVSVCIHLWHSLFYCLFLIPRGRWNGLKVLLSNDSWFGRWLRYRSKAGRAWYCESTMLDSGCIPIRRCVDRGQNIHVRQFPLWRQ